jgi:hypothetical protein
MARYAFSFLLLLYLFLTFPLPASSHHSRCICFSLIDCAFHYQTEKELAAEITAYDLKVHAAAVKMTDALVAELRGMSIPFFTLRKDLVRDSPSSEDSSSSLLQSQADSTAASSPITRSELIKLQQRMLELLEDLCKE